MEDNKKTIHRKKLDKLHKKSVKAEKRVERERKKIPKKTEYSWQRVLDETTGKASYVLKVEEKDKALIQDNPVKKVSDRVGLATNYLTHNKIREVEKENSAVEASHKAEEKVEDIYRYVKRYRKNKRQRQQKKAIKLEKKQLQATVNFQYQKFLEDNPQMQVQSLKKQIQKRIQKQRIKRQYAKAYQKDRKSVV